MYLSGTVKVLHLSADYFVYYECVGNQVDEFGACARDAEYVEINSRRRGINAADMRMLQQVVTSQTCVDTSQFVRMNQTREWGVFVYIYLKGIELCFDELWHWFSELSYSLTLIRSRAHSLDLLIESPVLRITYVPSNNHC